MAAPTNYYVDPAINANSGTGTIGDPYGDLQYALDSVTRDATNGDQLNIKAGTDEILAAALDLTTYGTPSLAAPLIFRGYTSSANDGGTGGIDGNGSPVFSTTTIENVSWIHLHLHNAGAIGPVLGLDRFSYAIECEVDDCGGAGINLTSGYGGVSGCHIHDCGGDGVDDAGRSVITSNYFKNDGTHDFINAINATGSDGGLSVISRNIISIDGASNGIARSNWGHTVISNSVLSAGGTGFGIEIPRPLSSSVLNNLVEGFSGAGGRGFYGSTATTEEIGVIAGNAAYNNTTNYNVGDSVFSEDNESLASSPFDKSGSDTFANRFTYFAPANVGNVRGGAYPSGIRLDKGAVQHADPAGGGGLLIHPGMSGGMRA